jgi:hypothetical protein
MAIVPHACGWACVHACAWLACILDLLKGFLDHCHWCRELGCWPLLQASVEEDDEEEGGEGLMAAYGCMRALSTVLDSVSSMPALFPQLEAILFPVMQVLRLSCVSWCTVSHAVHAKGRLSPGMHGRQSCQGMLRLVARRSLRSAEQS